MIVSIIRVKLYAPWIHSLKEKRKLVKSLCQKLKNRFNVSVIESDVQDIHQTIIVSIAFLSSDNAQAGKTQEGIYHFILSSTDAQILDFDVEKL